MQRLYREPRDLERAVVRPCRDEADDRTVAFGARDPHGRRCVTAEHGRETLVGEHGDVERMGLRERDEIRADGLHEGRERTAKTGHAAIVARRRSPLTFLTWRA